MPGATELDIRYQPGHTPALDGVRGVAILLVMFFHLLKTDVTPFMYLSQIGWVGVDLFFVLSGFLITGILLDSKEAPHYIRKFYVRRVLRIFPLYYMVLSSILLYALFIEPARYAYHIENQLFFWTYTQNILFTIDGWPANSYLLNHFWSLAIEEQFYLFWPLLLYFLSRQGLLLACGLIIAAAIAVRWYFYDVPFSYILTICRMDTLAIGSAAAVLIRFHASMLSKIVIPIGALTFVATVFAFEFAGTPNPIYIQHVIVSYTTFSIFFAAVIVMTFDSGKVGKILRSGFEIGLLRFLGKYSYGIYVYHWIVLMVLSSLYSEVPFIVSTMVTLIISVASYHLVEERFLRLKDRFA